MDLRRTSLLLPCHGLADFPTYLKGQQAESLLAAWTALWHPDLLAATGLAPSWHSADDLPEANSLSGELLVIPEVSRHVIPDSWLSDFHAAKDDGRIASVGFSDRTQLVDCWEEREVIHRDVANSSLIADFFALGFCYLQVELITQSMQYHGLVDPDELNAAAVDAAKAAVAGDEPKSREHLGRAFDLLAQARQHYYPVDSYLIDLTLLNPHADFAALISELKASPAVSLLANGATLHQLSETNPLCLQQIKESAHKQTACVVGGRHQTGPVEFLSPEAILRDFAKGRSTAEALLGCPVRTFGQYETTSSPQLPQILKQLQFNGALLTTFDGKRVPPQGQAKTGWQGNDGTVIDALSAVPRDTGRVETFLAFSEHLSQAMQFDHVATVLLAGWPGQRSDFYEDLQRSMHYGPVLGKPITLEQYFDESAHSDYWQKARLNDPPQRLLPQKTNAELIAKHVCQHVAMVQQEYRELLSSLADAVRQEDREETAASGKCTPAKEIAAAIAPSGDTNEQSSLAVNAWSFPQSMVIGDSNEHRWMTPGLGFRIVGDKPLERKVIVEEHRLCNEFLEVVVSEETGGIQAIRTHDDRDNRLSQRIVGVNVQEPGEVTGEICMIADAVEIDESSSSTGTIISHGHLIAGEDTTLATFSQAISLAPSSKHCVVELTLEISNPLTGRPWHSYFASRLLWRDEFVDMSHGTIWQTTQTTGDYLCAPDWIQVASPGNAARSIAVATLGLPFHRRRGTNSLDSILVCAGDASFHCRMAIGLDCSQPWEIGLAELIPWTDSVAPCGKANLQEGWFFHLSSRSAVVTHANSLDAEQPGVQLRLLDLAGQPKRIRVSAWRPFAEGHLTDFTGKRLEPLEVEEGSLLVDLGAYRWLQLAGLWES